MAVNQFPTVPINMADTSKHIRQVAITLNNTIDGKLNSTGVLTLNANATSTTLTDLRISENSIILFMPTTSNGNSAKTSLFVSALSSGTATLTHASSSNADQNFKYVIIG